MSAIIWKNYLVKSIYAPGDAGHIIADDLPSKVLSHDGSTAYHCMFDLEPRPTFNSYKGMMRPASGRFIFDFDGPEALQDARAFARFLGVDDIDISFSGMKGFHVDVPEGYFGLSWSNDLDLRVKALATELKKRFPSLDVTIYKANHKIRVLGSRHEKSGLYKTPLSRNEFESLGIVEIRALARTRR